MNIKIACKTTELNWASVKEIESKLEKLKYKLESINITLRQYPYEHTFNSIDKAIEKRKGHGEFKYYDIDINGINMRDERFYIYVSKYTNLADEHLQYLKISNINKEDDILELMEYLSLIKDDYDISKNFEKKVFIAHKFNETGINLADKVARFLELLDFEVITGRSYSPESIVTKVKKRIEEQSIMIAIYSKGDDNTWVNQESIIGSINKPLFILKEKNVDFKSGILSDHEFIQFPSNNIEKSFISILEGLREIKAI